jgi:hypothetical protein
MVTVVDVDGFTVMMENAAVVAPAATVTDVAGTAVLPLDVPSETVTPPVGAASLIATVPVTVVPPVTDALESVRPDAAGAASTLTVVVPTILPDAACTVAIPATEPAVKPPEVLIVPSTAEATVEGIDQVKVG